MACLPQELLTEPTLMNIVAHMVERQHPLTDDGAVLYDFLIENYGPDFKLPVCTPYSNPTPHTLRIQKWCVRDVLREVQASHPYPLPDHEKHCVWAAQDWLKNPTEINRKRAFLAGNKVLNTREVTDTMPADIAFTAGMYPWSACTVAYPNVVDRRTRALRYHRDTGVVLPVIHLLVLLAEHLPD